MRRGVLGFVFVPLVMFVWCTYAWSIERPYRNRGLDNISVVPGDSPGTVRTRIEWFAESDTTSFDLNFGTLIDIEVNGGAADWLDVPVVFSPFVTIEHWCPVHDAPTPGDGCLGPCYLERCGTILLGEPVQEVLGECYCRHHLMGMGLISECMCTGHFISFSSEMTLLPGAQIRVALTPASGSILEEYTLDDTLSTEYTPGIPTISTRGLLILIITISTLAAWYLRKRKQMLEA
jgi:hypothetical protein